jgi:hypothetical protein
MAPAVIFSLLMSASNRNYQLGLLCLTHLLIGADGVVEENEVQAFEVIRKKEKISDAIFSEFKKLINEKKEREIFEAGTTLIAACTHEEKLNAFVNLYKLSEVDGRVHVKEIRFLLYSIKLAGVEFNHVAAKALTTPSLL